MQCLSVRVFRPSANRNRLRANPHGHLMQRFIAIALCYLFDLLHSSAPFSSLVVAISCPCTAARNPFLCQCVAINSLVRSIITASILCCRSQFCSADIFNCASSSFVTFFWSFSSLPLFDIVSVRLYTHVLDYCSIACCCWIPYWYFHNRPVGTLSDWHMR